MMLPNSITSNDDVWVGRLPPSLVTVDEHVSKAATGTNGVFITISVTCFWC